MSLPTLRNSVEKLQTALRAKAKAEPSYRFYSLWDKVYRRDVLREAYRHCRANDGAPGVDGVTFDRIEAQGVEAWLAKLQEELRNKTYVSLPLLRIWIVSVRRTHLCSEDVRRYCTFRKGGAYGTEDIQVVELTGPVLAQAGSTMAAIRRHAGSVLPGT